MLRVLIGLCVVVSGCVRVGFGSRGELADRGPASDLADARSLDGRAVEAGPDAGAPISPPCFSAQAGLFEGTVWVQGRQRLELAPASGGFLSTGRYTSPPCDSQSATTLWTSILVQSDRPLGKPLLTVNDTGYAEANLDATGLSGLWHLDGVPGASASTKSIADLVGKLSPGTVTDSDASLKHATGRIGGGLSFDGKNDLITIADPQGALQFGQSDFTVMAWVRTTHVCNHWCGFLGRQVRANGAFTLELDDKNRSNMFLGYLTQLGNNIGGGAAVNDDRWHHLLGVKQGATGTLYLDGKLVDGQSLQNLVDYNSASPFELGGYSDGPQSSYPSPVRAAATLDEVAIWRRALSAKEARDLHLRGALRLLLQVRVCADPGCSGVPFVGPDGTPASTYSEAANASPSPSTHLLGPSFATGRYLQYRLTLESDSLEATPSIASVAVAHP